MLPLIVICGPTATGKSGLAMALAQRLDTIILSADSRQIYREFDIGTAKPSLSDRTRVPHYLIDTCEPTVTLTLADYQAQTQALVSCFHQKGQIPLLVGGTGLYIKSIIRGLKIPRVAPQPELRSQLQALGQTHAYKLLQQVDGAAAVAIHPNDQVRTLRALEVFYVTGRPITRQQGEDPPPYPVVQIGLDCHSMAGLEQRIAHRTEQMVEMGLVAEVEYLCQTYGTELPLLRTLGYQEMMQFLAGELSLEQAKQLTIRHTRQFAKRQRTWFRADSSIHWFDANHPQLMEQVWDVLPF
ncbi:MAG: tRNA (adenosine(37)-N6)-dimethylallyltransferase MiaA [Cyanothece sp. SIO2G6]|nr:tRNA (adenosine(37)-N6)-dimethylallyltransferase MiaA [Cyanothece sp. SIO2G6]